MEFEIVNTAAQPILYVTRRSSMDSGEIARTMAEAFGAIGAFIEHSGIAPIGPPLAIYRDWDGKSMEVDAGFPVRRNDAASAGPQIRSGETPAGKALKAVHRGSYMDLHRTYEAMEGHIKQTGLKSREIAWEVYLNDPEQTPEDQLLTEVYMPLA